MKTKAFINIKIGIFLVGIFSMLSLSFVCADIKNEDLKNQGYCPFGVCMGVDLKTLFESKDYAEKLSRYNLDEVRDFPLKHKFEWVDAIIVPSKGSIYTSAKVSPVTGVCAIAINITLHKDSDETIEMTNNRIKLINATKKYLNDEIGYEANKIEESEVYISYIWSGKRLSHLENISEIILRNMTDEGYESLQSFSSSLIYKFDNFSECENYNFDANDR